MMIDNASSLPPLQELPAQQHSVQSTVCRHGWPGQLTQLAPLAATAALQRALKPPVLLLPCKQRARAIQDLR